VIFVLNIFASCLVLVAILRLNVTKPEQVLLFDEQNVLIEETN